MPGAPRFRVLQSLRALAAWAVGAFHVFLLAGCPPDGPWLHLQAGVDLFFVLSGFVVTRAALTASGAADFLLRRLLRIYPPYWLCTAALVAALLWRTGEWPAPGHLLASALLWPQDEWPLLGVAWSLMHEVFFYLVLTAFVATGRRRPSTWLAVWAALAIGFALLRAAIPEFQPPAPLRVAIHPLNLEFIAGACLALLPRSPGSSRSPLFCLAAALALGSTVFFIPQLPMDGLARPLCYGLPAWLLIRACVDGETSRGWRVPGLLPRLGDASYAFYLIHAPILAAIALATPRLFPALPLAPVLGLGLPVIQILALSLWLGFERPLLRRLADRLKPATPPRSPSPCASCG